MELSIKRLGPSMNSPASEPAPSETSSAMKFTYPSGARPLEGYTIKRGIGRGGFGEVYFAVSDAGKEVALKLIRRHLDVELRGVRQCLNLKHPNLLAIHDIRSDGQDDRWVVMEYISGGSLEAAIERNPNGMPLEEVLDWFRGIIAGVGYLHDRGIVHRDLKPGNIFKDEGIVKIGDYGLAKFVSCSRRSGQTETVGTVHYIAPEISRGRYGKEVDTYALGIILYEMLTGRAPFEGESVAEVLMKHLDTPPDLSPLDPAFRAIVGKALHKDPDARFKHVKEMLVMLPGNSAHPSAGYHASSNPASPAAGVQANGSEAASDRHAAGQAAGAEVIANEIEVVDEEPVWRFLRQTFGQMSDAWHRADLNPILRVLIIGGALFALLTSAGALFPLAFVLMIVYFVYLGIRSLVLMSSRPQRRSHFAVRGPTNAHRPTANHPPARPIVHSRRTENWRRAEPVTAEVVFKSARQKVTELTGSMLLAALIAGIMAVVMLVLRRDRAMEPEQMVWLTLVGILGSWAVMIPAKIWEGTETEQTARRFTMLVAGLLLGLAASGLAQFLSVELFPESSEALSRWLTRDVATNFYSPTGEPSLVAYLAYFGFLMFILRWWKQADPNRGTRVSLWSIAVSVFGAWVLHLFWPFPQPWGLMLAATIAVSVQLASPWQCRQRR
jgi:hypothetical protein